MQWAVDHPVLSSLAAGLVGWGIFGVLMYLENWYHGKSQTWEGFYHDPD